LIFLDCWKLLSGILRVGAVFLEGLVMPDLHRLLTSSFHSGEEVEEERRNAEGWRKRQD